MPHARGALGSAVRWLTVLGMTVALGMLVLGAGVLLDARSDAWRQAQQASANLVMALERDISRNIAVYDLSLQGAIDAIHHPGIEGVSKPIRHSAIFDRAASAEYLGSLLVLDGTGEIVADSTSVEPHQLNLGDRDYFLVHRDNPDAGLYLSKPFRSRLRGGDGSIAISRRLSAPDGSFEGVVVGTLRLAYFQDLFSTLNLGAAGTVALARPDGEVVVRQPALPGDFARNVGNSIVLQHYATEKSGQFVGPSALDGRLRSFTYRQVGTLPLLLVQTDTVDGIFAAWRQKAYGIGSIMVLLCGATVVLCLLFRREVSRRVGAEAALVEAAERLVVIAATDELTGLGNRRNFEVQLLQEWRRARGQTNLALLMIDVDWFKAYNDRYGHPAGDDVLRRVAAAIRGSIRRPSDLAARYGGEEFVALLPDTSLAGAQNTAERICEAIAALDIPHEGSPLDKISLSIGIAVTRPIAGAAEVQLVRRADTALYDAKRAGRARFCVAPDEVAEAVPNPADQALAGGASHALGSGGRGMAAPRLP